MSFFSWLFGKGKSAPPPAEGTVIPPVLPAAPRYNLTFATGDIPPGGGGIDPAFDNDSGDLPPDWEARRLAILHQHNFWCQATGCIESGNQIQVHHIKERWQGGTHRLENLVSLCPLHHALVHLEIKRLEFKDTRYVVVSRYWKRKPFSSKKIVVRSHVRRFELISSVELAVVRERFKPKCHWCGELDWKGNWRERENLIWTWCPKCNGRWEFEPGLIEETATQIILAFPATQNLGRFYFNGALIYGLRPPSSFEGCPECLRNGRRGYLIERDGQFGRFIGCSDWPACKYTRSN